MDISIAVPSPRVHGDAVTPTSASFSLPSPPPPSQQQQQQQTAEQDAPTTLVHARLDARDVMASASDSGQEDEDSQCSSPRPSIARPASTGQHQQQSDDDIAARDVDEMDDDVERFDGKIVYNPDGSAYIIEESSAGGGSDLDDCPVPLPKLAGAIVDGRRDPSRPLDDPVPQIASALYVTRHFAGAGGKASAASSSSETGPVMHSFRVYSARSSGSEPPPMPAEAIQTGLIASKPILMCFVCKLSFGTAKTLVSHATSEHRVTPEAEEKRILSQPNTSAILQLVGKSKEPVIAFLEPVRTGVLPIQHHQGSTGADSAVQLNTSNSSSGNSSSQTPTDDVESHHHHHAAKTEAHDESFETKETVVSGRPESSTPPVSSHIVHGAPAPVMNNGRPSSPSTPSPVSPPNHPLTSPVNMAAMAAAAAAAAAAAGFGHPFAANPAAFPGADPSLLNPALTSSAAAAMALASRNSCKTLKCPKCNWHYKYQETLEIHMKEKHPESETSCIYCLTGQAHPRLARGETYTCGYKPYRCDVCNYSTTTKGNLSIHMQSDKHLNNAQELQNSANAAAAAAAAANGSTSAHNTSAESLSSSPNKNSSGSSGVLHPSPSPSGGAGAASPASKAVASAAKPSFRCDVCNYETNVGRNLRIHMTSEKHTHNMIMLQQNVKRMQQLSALSAQQGIDPSGAGGAEAALADMAYQQALFIQMMTGGQLPNSQGVDPMAGGWPGNAMAAAPGSPMVDPGLNPETMEPPPEPMESNPHHAFQCLVCSVFGSDSAEVLAQHVAADRSRQREHEALLLIGGHYLCRLCAYKTTLKANFQLHCKTDKHLQRLQHATHIQEGGARNDWKLQYVTSTTNPVQLRCNVCEYYTNSVHKMQVHSAHPRHQLALDLFRYVSDEAAALAGRSPSSVQYQCRLCQFECPSKTTLMQHARSLRHCQLEQLAELQRRGAANGKEVSPLELRDLFAVVASSSDSDQEDAGAVNETNGTDGASPADAASARESDESTLAATSAAKTGNVQTGSATSSSDGMCCPLCQNRFADKAQLELHAATAHNVNAEGLERLMLLVEQASFLSAKSNHDEAGSGDESESNALPVSRAGGIPPATVSERHAYKYRCPQCSLAFKTLEKLQLHSQYHVIRDATKCPLCGRSFRSILSLQKHLESSHAELTDEEANILRQSLLSHPLLLSGLAGQASEAAISEYLRREQAAAAELSGAEDEDDDGNAAAPMDVDAQDDGADESGDVDANDLRPNEQRTGNDGQPMGTPLEEYLNSPAVAEETYADPARKFKCHRCKMAFTSQSYLTSHNKTMQHRKGEKLNYPMEKYLDPNRPFKCDVCKESFTQKNILLVHYNSVSHLHKLKRAAAGNTDSAPTTPTPNSVNRPERPVTANSTSSVTSDSPANGGKPWKCNICKVAYSQGSTLDIHLRSVLHQTRASKLQELAAAGQIDLTRPLIEQPTGSAASSPESPAGRAAKSEAADSLQQQQQQQHQQQQQQQQQLALALGQLYGLTPEQILQQQQQQHIVQQYYQAAGLQMPDNWPLKTGSDPSESPTALPDEGVNNNKLPARRSSRMLKHLLGSYGFELVMQFNECHQKQRGQAKAQETDAQSAAAAAAAEANSLNTSTVSDPAEEENKENAMETDAVGDKAPEVQRCVCPLCHKSFSSIWVLKAHSEEVHRQMVPPHCVEQCADELKRSANLTPANSAPPLSPVERLPPPGNIDRPDNEPEGNVKQESIPTPTASSTPISSTPGNDNSNQNAAQQALAQQMNDMQGVLNAMGLASQLQQQFNPMMMGLAGLGLPAAGLGFNMPAAALAAMNMQPQLMNPFMMAGHFDPIQAAMAAQAAAAQGNPFLQQAMDPSGLLAKQQQLMQQQQQQPAASGSAAAAAAANGPQQPGQQQKRARTRISDDQLKILRAHFDINNSPSEETIAEMARQSGLPTKVIKHWFRNTLFKERQRNKDSPYNFSNPPSTTLNLEEYEKTGEAKVTQLKTEEQLEIQRALLAARPQPTPKPKNSSASVAAPSPAPATPEVPIKKEADASETSTHANDEGNHSTSQMMPTTPGHPFHMRSSSPMTNLSLASLISSQLNVDTKNLGQGAMFPPRPATSNSALPSPAAGGVSLAGLSPGRLNSDQGPFNFFTTSTPLPMAPLTPPGGSGSGNNSSGGGPGSSTGKRANRTRFTDYQIKVLQEFFENNAYPKDDDLEYLSKLLSLSPRVIVVWFQNARQKARKVYENQPPVAGGADPAGSPAAGTDDGTGRFQRTPGLNYQCKKCLLVFQRYYELIRHQKTHCFKEEDAKRSAVAQAAAAQAAACFSSSDNDNSNSSSLADAGAAKASPAVKAEARDSTPAPPPPKQPELFQATPQPPPAPATPTQAQQQQHQQQQNDSAFHCEQCGLNFSRFDLWREHQIVHIMNPDLFGGSGVKLPPGMESQYAALLQQHQAAVVAAAAAQLQASLPATSAGSSGQMTPPASTGPLVPSGSKRKHDEEEEDRKTGGAGSGTGSIGNESSEGQPRDKRLRTTILPEQLDFLYQQYQLESNPSRKMLETISREVGLKKRVVQVWFQNTRARERKGQFRAHAQVINKRCPFCPALFKVKSALESHLASRHPDQLAKGDVNIDALPDMTDEDSDTGGVNSSPLVGSSGASVEANSAAAIQEALTKRLSAVSNYQQSMASLSMLSSLYSQGFVAPLPGFEGKAEDALKRYANDYLAAAAAASNAGSSSASSTPAPSGNATAGPTGEAPLDLSRPLPGGIGQVRPESAMQSDMGGDDTRSEHYMDYFDESNPSSPLPFKLNQSGGGGSSGGQASGQAKRFRTQMSAVQVRVMKSLFSDYKTPTMAECEALGREIGLPKRVVQVWFQNARAKEKKSKLNAQKAAGDMSGNDSSSGKQPDGCELCDFKYSHKYAVQDHIFTHQHIERVKQHVAEQTGKHSDDVGSSSRPKSNSHADNQEPSTSSSTPTPGASAGDNSESAQLEALLLHQLYGLGYGAGAMPAAALAAAAAAAAYSNQQQQQPGNMAAAAGQQQTMWSQGGENYMLAMLQRSPAALQQIARTFNEPGVSEARFTLDGSSRASLSEHLSQVEQKLIASHSTDVGVLCKACQTLYGSEAAVVQHQRSGCPQTAESSSSSNGGATRLVLLQYDCVACDEKLATLAELRNHLNGDAHRRAATKFANGGGGGGDAADQTLAPPLPPTSDSPSSGLNSQIEDVVKQLTALAQATGSGAATGAPSFGAKANSGDCDTNANIAQRKAATYGQ